MCSFKQHWGRNKREIEEATWSRLTRAGSLCSTVLEWCCEYIRAMREARL